VTIIITNTVDYAAGDIPDKTIKELAGIKLVGKGAANIVQVNNENILKILLDLNHHLTLCLGNYGMLLKNKF